MKKIIAFILIASITACTSSKKLSNLQTQIHDIANQMQDAQKEEAAYQSFKSDCIIQTLTMGMDSFAWYTKCPNSAKPIRKAVINKSYKLIHENQ